MKTCAKCSQQYGDDKKYCLRCGISLDTGSVTELICVKCRTSNWPDFNFCKKCGTSFKQKGESVVSSERIMDQPSDFLAEKEPNINMEHGEKRGLTDEVKKQIERIAKEAFTKAGIVSKESVLDENKFNIAVTIAYKMLPMPVRFIVRKETLTVLLKEMLLKNTVVSETTATDFKSNKVKLPEKNIQTKSSVITITGLEKKKKTNYFKLGIIVIIFFGIIIVGFFVKSYLAKSQNEPEKDIVQKPQPIQPQKPVEQPKTVGLPPVDEQPKEQPPAIAVEQLSKPTATKNQPVTTERAVSDQKAKKQEATAKSKQQAGPTESTREQEPKKQDKKSFAPHSRDDL